MDKKIPSAQSTCRVCKEPFDNMKCPNVKVECCRCCGDPDHYDYVCVDCDYDDVERLFVVTWARGYREELCEPCHDLRLDT